jgi:hypothetical protein
MCSGGGGGSYTPPKIDPAPTVVQNSDVQADSGKNERKERRRVNRESTIRSLDRDTILGGLAAGNDKLG